MKTNRAGLSNWFGVALTTVDVWIGEGMPVEESGGRGKAMTIDSVKASKWLMEREIKKINVIDNLIKREDLRRKKRENDIDEGAVAPGELLVEALEKTCNAMVPILESLPLMIKRNFPEITGDQILMVKKAISECKNIMATTEIGFDA